MNLKRIVTRVLQHVWFIGERPLIYYGVPVGVRNKVLFMGECIIALKVLIHRYFLCTFVPVIVLSLIEMINPHESVVRAAGTIESIFLCLCVICWLFLLLISRGNMCFYVSMNKKDVIEDREKFVKTHPDAAGLVSDVVPVSGFHYDYYMYTCKLIR